MTDKEQSERIKKIIVERGIDSASEWIAKDIGARQEVIDLMTKDIVSYKDIVERAKNALRILFYYNPLHNDFEDYLQRVAEYGLGRKDSLPDPDKFVTGLPSNQTVIDTQIAYEIRYPKEPED